MNLNNELTCTVTAESRRVVSPLSWDWCFLFVALFHELKQSNTWSAERIVLQSKYIEGLLPGRLSSERLSLEGLLPGRLSQERLSLQGLLPGRLSQERLLLERLLPGRLSKERLSLEGIVT
jgi:hypothetical protein